MGKKHNLASQAKGKLLSMRAYGQSKHADKAANGGKPATEKIYSIKTMDNYIASAERFARWASSERGCRTLEEARSYTGEYLNRRMEEGKSAWTVRAEAAALGKLYQCQTTDLGAVLPVRMQCAVTQHRTEAWRGHFSEEKHADLVEVGKTCGLRRHELAALRPEDVRLNADGRAVVSVQQGKGGKYREVTALNDKPFVYAQKAEAEGRSVIFEHIPKYMPEHEYRAEFAQAMYDEIARDPAELPRSECYYCRGERAGEVYDKAAMLEVSEALGHSRLDVMMAYLR